MRRRNHKASPVPPGYVRRSGPTSCIVMPPTGCHVDDMKKLRVAGLIYAGVLPYGMDVSLELWGEFIEQNHDRSHRDEDYLRLGDYLPPDDSAVLLKAMGQNYAGRGQHAITY